MSLKFYALKVQEIIHETDEAVSISFDIPENIQDVFRFKAGQYITLKTQLDGEELRRSYSICTAPFENNLKIGVKKIENGRFSTFAKEKLNVGDVLEVMPPTGTFTLNDESNQEQSFLLIAAGSGITPILSLCKTLLNESTSHQVTLLFGNKNFGSIMFREEIEALKNNYLNQLNVIHILSRENLGNSLQKGRIDADKLNQLTHSILKHNTFDHVYVCGPESMVHDVKSKFEGTASKVHFELFGTPVAQSAQQKTSAAEGQVDAFVKIIIDGDEIDFPMTASGPSILDVAHQNGADLPYACKGGVCCTCKAKILEGTAVMTVNYALEKDEVEAGYILTCQAHPTSAKLTVSFDD